MDKLGKDEMNYHALRSGMLASKHLDILPLIKCQLTHMSEIESHNTPKGVSWKNIS